MQDPDTMNNRIINPKSRQMGYKTARQGSIFQNLAAYILTQIPQRTPHMIGQRLGDDAQVR